MRTVSQESILTRDWLLCFTYLCVLWNDNLLLLSSSNLLHPRTLQIVLVCSSQFLLYQLNYHFITFFKLLESKMCFSLDNLDSVIAVHEKGKGCSGYDMAIWWRMKRFLILVVEVLGYQANWCVLFLTTTRDFFYKR